MSAFYRRSAIYAAFFAPSDDIRRSIDALVRRHLRRAPKRVIDPACGPGLWLEHFHRQGAEVAGCDLEESAIAGASERLPKRGARVLVGDMRRPPDELGAEFDCAINLDNSIGHLNDPLDVVAHFASMRQRLSPRGIYVIGLAIREAKDAIPTGIVFERGPVDIAGGGFAALRTESLGLDPVTRCERIRQITITANVPDTPSVIAEQYDLLTFTFAMLRDILDAAGGFEVLDCRDATDEDLPAKPFRKGAGDVVLVLRAKDAARKPVAKSARKSRLKSAGNAARKPTPKSTPKSATPRARTKR
jgi:SAM-dependent methyltransferase